VKLLSDSAIVRWTIQDTSTVPIDVHGNDIEIAGFDFKGMYWVAIWANREGQTKYSGIKIHDNKFSGWGTGSVGAYVVITGYDNADVYGNEFYTNDDAIQIMAGDGFDVKNIKVHDNIVYDANMEIGGWSILTVGTLRNVSVYGNYLELGSETGHGYIVLSSSIDTAKIYDNEIVNGGRYGIDFIGIHKR